jgi:ATP-dependent exoDNAse (exonuclease V) alpha subunit
MRKNLTTQKSFYVSISRAKDKATLFVDSKQNSIAKIQENTGQKISSIEHQNIQKTNQK